MKINNFGASLNYRSIEDSTTYFTDVNYHEKPELQERINQYLSKVMPDVNYHDKQELQERRNQYLSKVMTFR